MIRSEDRRKVAEEVLKKIINKNVDRDGIHKLKTKIASKHSSEIPSNEEILELANSRERKKVEKKLRRRPSRSKSGVSIVAVMTSPKKCPHGTCVPCPKGEEVPQSYVKKEPAVMRARHNSFDPFEQTKNRLEQLKLTGHPVSKIELIIMGGTFPARDFSYQKKFVKGCYDALNESKSESLEAAISSNETSEHRCVGLTVETRPDFSKKKEINRMLKYGATRVELGVQIPDNRIYRKIKRGHKVKDVEESTALLKDSGFKVTYHYMPNLPGSNLKKDLEEFKKLFSDERFMPDSLKIYPTLVIEGSELEKWYEEGKYRPYPDKDLKELLLKMKKEIPPWVRVMRLHRDVPSQAIVAGFQKSNLRQILRRELEERGEKCRCIRCREVGRSDWELSDLNFDLKKREFKASGGKEFFISFEDEEKDVIAALLRFRIPSEPFREEIGKKTGIVRELHVYGTEVPVDGEESEVQHHGMGKKLLKKAEEIAEKEGMDKVIIISGVGAREYYRKLGYKLKGAYMGKDL